MVTTLNKLNSNTNNILNKNAKSETYEIKKNSDFFSPQLGVEATPPPHSPNEFFNWLETKHQQEVAKLRQLLFYYPQPQSVPFSPCSPQFGGRHSWNPFAVKLPQGKIYQCQFCFREKLMSINPQQHTQYYPPQTYYVR
ncbi:MAG: hypothetical protein I3273_04150 [Candidatus Moeniiplasma glomeromycotorum]|nr:hypothetical protein [Candidatus Moeniiplasma glomeromycotorum]